MSRRSRNATLSTSAAAWVSAIILRSRAPRTPPCSLAEAAFCSDSASRAARARSRPARRRQAARRYRLLDAQKSGRVLRWRRRLALFHGRALRRRRAAFRRRLAAAAGLLALVGRRRRRLLLVCAAEHADEARRRVADPRVRRLRLGADRVELRLRRLGAGVVLGDDRLLLEERHVRRALAELLELGLGRLAHERVLEVLGECRCALLRERLRGEHHDILGDVAARVGFFGRALFGAAGWCRPRAEPPGGAWDGSTRALSHAAGRPHPNFFVVSPATRSVTCVLGCEREESSCAAVTATTINMDPAEVRAAALARNSAFCARNSAQFRSQHHAAHTLSRSSAPSASSTASSRRTPSRRCSTTSRRRTTMSSTRRRTRTSCVLPEADGAMSVVSRSRTEGCAEFVPRDQLSVTYS